MPPQSKEYENKNYNEHVETKRMKNWARSIKKWTKRMKNGLIKCEIKYEKWSLA